MRILESTKFQKVITKLRTRKIKRENFESSNQLQGKDRKKSKQEMIAKMKEEVFIPKIATILDVSLVFLVIVITVLMFECFVQVAADYKAVAYTPDIEERKRMQSETLSAVFETYFRILRHTMQSSVARFV